MTLIAAPIRFGRALDRAGILDRPSRLGYRSAARGVLRGDSAHYLAVRSLIPAELQPHLLAVYWFGRTTDLITDSGPRAGRQERYDRWTRATRRALDGDPEAVGSDPRLAAFVRTASECGLPPLWVDRFLTGMRDDTSCTGLDSEQEFEAYVDRVALPYLMLLLGIHPGCREEAQLRAFRLLASACQRIDFLSDLADDARSARARLTGQGLGEQIARARAAVRAAHPVLDLTPLELRPMMSAFLLMHELHLEAIARSGDRVLDRRVGHPVLATARLLLTGRGQVRHV